jgi:hypothetical protein
MGNVKEVFVLIPEFVYKMESGCFFKHKARV